MRVTKSSEPEILVTGFDVVVTTKDRGAEEFLSAANYMFKEGCLIVVMPDHTGTIIPFSRIEEVEVKPVTDEKRIIA